MILAMNMQLLVLMMMGAFCCLCIFQVISEWGRCTGFAPHDRCVKITFTVLILWIVITEEIYSVYSFLSPYSNFQFWLFTQSACKIQTKQLLIFAIVIIILLGVSLLIYI